MSRIRVPLAVDAHLGMDVGPFRLPVRAIAVAAASLPLALLCLHLPLPFGLRVIAATTLVTGMLVVSVPLREGVWIVTYWMYRVMTARLMPNTVHHGQPGRAKVDLLEEGVETRTLPGRMARLGPFRRHMKLPRMTETRDGLLHVDGLGWRAVVRLEVPPVAAASSAYARWCETVVRWLLTLDCPAQLITSIAHVSRATAEQAWDDTTKVEPGPLGSLEREFAGDLAVASLGLTHHVVWAPRTADGDGIPNGSTALRRPGPTGRTDAERVLEAGMRLARDSGLAVSLPSQEEIACDLVGRSMLSVAEAAVSPSGLWMDGVHVGIVAVVGLPPDVDHGLLVDVLQRSHAAGVCSMHLVPARREAVRRHLRRHRSWLRASVREGRGDVDAEVALADADRLQAELAAGNATGLRMAVTVAVRSRSRSERDGAVERMADLFIGHGFRVATPSVPGFLPALSLAPGAAPLRRALQLTTDSVAVRLLPALGTPFSDVRAPIIGANLRTGTTAYLSVWSHSNHNVVLVGSSGAGKSTAAKTLLARHCMRGAGAVVLDPDSEYEPLINLLGGRYIELPDAAINPLAVGRGLPADEAAEVVVTVLSVLGGDTVAYVGGRPVRRLPGEDKAWLHGWVATFLAANSPSTHEPILSELLEHLHTAVSGDDTLTDGERERYRRICLRLAAYTRGSLARVFDSPSTLELDFDQPLGVGFRGLSLRYAADPTPAVAVVLAHLLGALQALQRPLIVVVDEAHVLTSDPDAGLVLEQLVRRARKCGAGVWMASQRIEEFLETDLGRTLASTAATKLVLGHEETVADKVRRLFDLADDEAAALTPPVPGRGVLIAGSERTVVQVMPSPVLWPWVRSDTAAATHEAVA